MPSKIENKNKKPVIFSLWSRIFYILILMLIMLSMFAVVFFSWRDFISLINLNDRVYFSWRVFFISFGFPISIHMLYSLMIACFLDKPRPYKGHMVNFLVWLFFLAFIFSIPVSLYVDNKLKYFGYVTCSKKSLIAPNEYVRNINLCH
ncbi:MULTISPECIES: DUF1240 domain-containing protein [Xenorhabdus]|uniref:DUF1240 domain-containing protein n=1 Tax=Xenorhabdus TaxID=626 RepID=UPI00069A3D53|nr:MULTISPECIES: DUF1240 domain-containing protein [Xenorhabdus]WFQ78088.1 DUF1240 domain-containing protein [Xenorhabdus sp. SF857]